MFIYGFFSTLILIVACTGFGRSLLTLLGAKRVFRDELENFVFCFIAGQGILGWLLYFPGVLGLFSYNVFIIVLASGILLYFIFYFHNKKLLLLPNINIPKLSIEKKIIIVIIVLIITIDVLEAIAPPSDADTLAYHFALPKQFLSDNAVIFFPKAVDAAVPLLVHLTYAAALQIGGETGLTFWTMLTGWNTSLLVYLVARRYVPNTWAVLSAVIFLTSPAVLFSGGTGHVEIRCAAFVLASVFFLIEAKNNPSLKFVALAGMFAGFYLGSKYFGLFFVLASLPIILVEKNPKKNLTLYLAMVLATGFQWYLWNYLHTSDPLFPSLTNFLNYPDSNFWNRDLGAHFTKLLKQGDLPLTVNLLNWLLFPFIAAFNLVEGLNAGRTGFGIFLILILPMTCIGFVRYTTINSNIMFPLIIAFIFFTIWFFSGTTQRVRHLLPIYPLILIACVSISWSFFNRINAMNLFGLCFAIVIFIQTAGQMVFGYNYLKFAFLGETRKSFLERNVQYAAAVHWTNENLPSGSRVAHSQRGISYLFEDTSFMLHPYFQTIVEARPSTNNKVTFNTQLKAEGITHLILPNKKKNDANSAFEKMVIELAESGCLKTLRTFDILKLTSRTLKNLDLSRKNREATYAIEDGIIFKIIYNNCA